MAGRTTDFNGRVSQQYRNPGANGRTASTSTKRKEEDSNAFMRLPDKEIAGCISDIGVPFTVADLQKPNPQQIQLVFEWFAELLMNATRETVEPAMRAAADDVCDKYADIVPVETRNLMGFYVSLRRLLIDCGVSDFSFQDLIKPTHERMVRIFSYVINFVRFRESQTAVIDEHFNKAETTKARIEALYVENQDVDMHVAEMRRSRQAIEAEVKDKMRRNDELKTRLLELRKGQDRITDRLERVKAEKTRVTELLEDTTAAALAVKQDSSKLRPYVLQSPAALQSSLVDLSSSVQAERGRTEALDRRARALQTSADTFGAVAADVASCIRLLEEVCSELQKEDDEAMRAARHRDALSERGNNVREVERTELMLQRQLANWNDRTDKLRRRSKDKANEAKERMEELRRVHAHLTEERSDKAREMERRRVRIEQTEKKMADLKESVEREIHAAHDEFLRLDSHIKLYVTEMEQCM